VRDLGTRRDCSAILSAVAALSSELGMQTTVEGVETPQQFDAIAALGFSEAQGYLFSKAVPVSHVPDLLSRVTAVTEAPRQIARAVFAFARG
jgi:EAL domain-containing protein (putative c-di-GMP-specific phosphodiesterase class I)